MSGTVPFVCWLNLKVGISPSRLLSNGTGCDFSIPYKQKCEKCKHFSASKYHKGIFENLVNGIKNGIQGGD